MFKPLADYANFADLISNSAESVKSARKQFSTLRN